MPDSAVRQQLNLLLGAYGYNLYDAKNRARADDLLVRQSAASALGGAADALRELRTDYRRRFIPPPSREQPEPPRERLDQLGAIAELQQRIADLETRVRGMTTPAQDRVWERFRREQTLLNELLLADYNLIAPCQELRDRARALGAADWSDEHATELRRQIDQIERAVQVRAELLSLAG